MKQKTDFESNVFLVDPDFPDRAFALLKDATMSAVHFQRCCLSKAMFL